MAQKLYCTSSDMSVPSKALQGVATDTIANAIARASSMADGYIRKRFDLPLQDWTQSLTQAVADIATWIVMKDRGFNPDAESTKVIQSSYRDALSWLEDVANNEVDPAFVDANGVGQDEDDAASKPVEKSFVVYGSSGSGFGNDGSSGSGGGGFWGR